MPAAASPPAMTIRAVAGKKAPMKAIDSPKVISPRIGPAQTALRAMKVPMS